MASQADKNNIGFCLIIITNNGDKKEGLDLKFDRFHNERDHVELWNTNESQIKLKFSS